MQIYGLLKMAAHIYATNPARSPYCWHYVSHLMIVPQKKLENEIEVVVKSMENLYLVLHNEGITMDNSYLKIEEITSSSNKHYYAGR